MLAPELGGAGVIPPDRLAEITDKLRDSQRKKLQDKVVKIFEYVQPKPQAAG